ncbi:MAG: hypothetical protein HXX81_07775 [Campylobacterales bacterium]|nr:hypothetical protein [Campylobacterales bacterium]
MIDRLSNLSKLENFLSKFDVKEFNAKLPMGLEVIKKNSHNSYELKLGNLVVTSKSENALDVGKKYWASVSKSSVGSIVISDLVKKPPFFQEKLPFFVDVEIFKKLVTEEKEPTNIYKQLIFENMANAKSKEDFLFNGNILFGLNQNVFTIPLKLDNNKAIIQYKKSKKKQNENEQTKIDFYAGFNNLGQIDGEIFLNGDSLSLNLGVEYKNSLTHLENELEDLTIFDKINIYLKKNIKELFEFKNSLLDIKG